MATLHPSRAPHAILRLAAASLASVLALAFSACGATLDLGDDAPGTDASGEGNAGETGGSLDAAARADAPDATGDAGACAEGGVAPGSACSPKPGDVDSANYRCEPFTAAALAGITESRSSNASFAIDQTSSVSAPSSILATLAAGASEYAWLSYVHPAGSFRTVSSEVDVHRIDLGAPTEIMRLTVTMGGVTQTVALVVNPAGNLDLTATAPSGGGTAIHPLATLASTLCVGGWSRVRMQLVYTGGTSMMAEVTLDGALAELPLPTDLVPGSSNIVSASVGAAKTEPGAVKLRIDNWTTFVD